LTKEKEGKKRRRWGGKAGITNNTFLRGRENIGIEENVP